MAQILSMVRDKEPVEKDCSELEGLLPVQFYGSRREASRIEPLRRLMVAMLVDAVRCFETKFDARQPATRQEFAEVRSWIFSDTDDGVFSFRAVCDALGIDYESIRKGLTRSKVKRLAGERRPHISTLCDARQMRFGVNPRGPDMYARYQLANCALSMRNSFKPIWEA